MDNRAVGAGLTTVHGFRNLGAQLEGMGKLDTVSHNAWPCSWKSRTSLCGARPGPPENDDGEDYMSGLAEEIAQCMLEEGEDGSSAHHCSGFMPSESPWGAPALLSTSPQSTLTGMSCWDLLSTGASSSGGLSSGISSPPTPVATSHVRNEEGNALDLLYAELIRLKVEDEIKARQQHLTQLKQQQHYQQLIWKMRQRQAACVGYEAVDALKFAQGGAQLTSYGSTQKASGNSSIYYRSKSRSDEVSQVRARRQAGSFWTGNQSHGVGQKSWSLTDQSILGHHHLTTSYASSGSHKAVSGSGLRAVFLGNPGARELRGTGVFLPRRLGNGHDSKRKPACSTVLLPSRIVQALNLNVEDTLVPNASPSGVPLRRDSRPAQARSPAILVDAVDSREKWAPFPAAPFSALQEVAPDICLPTEVAY